jgi:hypothetical protein
MIALLLLLMVAPTTSVPDEPTELGQRIEMEGATLFIPKGYRPQGEVVNVVLHLHGSPRVLEPAFVAAAWPAVLIEFNRQGLSRVYAEPFSDPKLLPRLLDQALQALRDAHLVARPALGKVVVSSFSAGFGGVREMLKVQTSFDRIDALIMEDSLYAGYTGSPSSHDVDPSLMEGFVRFARAAADAKKIFVLTHSAQVPEGYASTTETADYLLKAVGGKPSSTQTDWGEGWIQARRFSRRGLLVLGFRGGEGPDHLRHLRGIAQIWKASPPIFSD